MADTLNTSSKPENTAPAASVRDRTPEARPDCVVWEHRLLWRDYVIKIIHTCGWCRQQGVDHLSITCLAPDRAPLPITETGYKSHFLAEFEIAKAGGAVPYVEAWLNQEASTPEWHQQEQASRQMTLF
ncbi:hypothetical protein JMK10_17720 [Rhodovulum sulfidophilum]|uniref:hypothetical protein n=1 Tax=Rhodovulum sulfidophilum TaxID=35806 RepID=UPI0019205523|nr:hypothetical protein [Rhodovulum sulfidophilum]MBL3575658.1 hypothetical protein [Rhodovulum sulfidophilum]MCE8431410.1 hypothetical protein [Rhodovulum sulfidophilum]MCF4118591.1 hypothetical protein [Rhodovulum sulfidophilum]